MKLRYLFSTILASALLLVGCVEESFDSFDNIKLDKTYLTIPATGGEVTLSFKATTDWEFAKSDEWPNVITYEKDDKTGKDKVDEDGNKVIKESVPSWLTLKDGPMSGAAGEYDLVFSAEPIDGGREIEIQITAGGNAQYFRVRQGSMLASEATVKEVFEGADGKSYRVQGVCTSIANTYYGNWYLQDGTHPEEDLYIYGTKNADGQYDWESFDIEVGDSVMVEGPKTTYNGKTVELIDVSVIKVIKSLIKVVVPEEEVETGKIVAQEGASFEVKLAYKGSGVFYTIPDDYKSWITVDNMTYKSGTPTKIEPNPADTAIVMITALKNEGPSREGIIEFSSSNAKSTSKISYKFAQNGLAPISDVLKLSAGDPAMVAGTVVAVHGQGFIMSDETASIYVYTSSEPEFAVGNNIVVAGTFDNYYGTLQVKNISVISNDGADEVPEYPVAVDYTDPSDAANLPKYSVDNPTDYPYVKVRGTLDKDNYSTFVKVGEVKIVMYKTLNDWSALKGKQVDVVGYMMGYNSKYSEHQMIEISVEEANEAETVKLTPISDVAVGDDVYTVEGVVVAASAKAYVIADATGNMLVYGKDHGRKVFDKVRLTGTASRYNGYETNSIQFAVTDLEVRPAVTEYAYDPKVLTGAELDAMIEEKAVCEEVQFEGKLTISGNYVNIVVDGAEKQGSLYYIDATDYQNFKDKDVVVKGYVTGTHNYLNVLPYSVVEK